MPAFLVTPHPYPNSRKVKVVRKLQHFPPCQPLPINPIAPWLAGLRKVTREQTFGGMLDLVIKAARLDTSIWQTPGCPHPLPHLIPTPLYSPDISIISTSQKQKLQLGAESTPHPHARSTGMANVAEGPGTWWGPGPAPQGWVFPPRNFQKPHTIHIQGNKCC